MLGLSKENDDDLRRNEMKVEKAEKSSEGLIFKELPEHLKYAFLCEEKSKQMIIAVDLTTGKKIKKW